MWRSYCIYICIYTYIYFYAIVPHSKHVFNCIQIEIEKVTQIYFIYNICYSVLKIIIAVLFSSSTNMSVYAPSIEILLLVTLGGKAKSSSTVRVHECGVWVSIRKYYHVYWLINMSKLHLLALKGTCSLWVVYTLSEVVNIYFDKMSG